MNNRIEQLKQDVLQGKITQEELLKPVDRGVQGTYALKKPDGQWIWDLTWHEAVYIVRTDGGQIIQTSRGQRKKTSTARREEFRERHKKLFESSKRRSVSSFQQRDEGENKGSES